MSRHATGAFNVKIAPQSSDDGRMLGRLSIDKQFHGDLEGTSKGEMLTAGTAVTGSAVYVAVERVEGSLHGRTGSFALHHTGIMTRGEPSLSVHGRARLGHRRPRGPVRLDDHRHRRRRAFVRVRLQPAGVSRT